MKTFKICLPSSTSLILALFSLPMLPPSFSLPTRDLLQDTQSELEGIGLSIRSATPQPQYDKVELLQDTLFAFDKALNFFVSDYSAINVDGLFGIRLAEGELG